MLRRDTCRTLRYALALRRCLIEQGYAPSLVIGADEYVVSTWRRG